MKRPCACHLLHSPRKLVLTGGPGAGKTAVLEVLRATMCRHVVVLPEAAGMLFAGGFPRGREHDLRRAAQRAIYHVQCELEATVAGADAALVVCDRGTVDGAAYWPGPGELWTSVGSMLGRELERYDAVVHLRTPPHGAGYNHDNPLRIESATEAAAIDERIAGVWAPHRRRFEVGATADFMDKVRRAVTLVLAEVPACCGGTTPP